LTLEKGNSLGGDAPGGFCVCLDPFCSCSRHTSPLVSAFATAAQLVGDTSSTSLTYGGGVLAVILTLTPDRPGTVMLTL
jgi:hypothetical protein